MSLKTSPPRNNELELSLFGPGVGESAVVHLGNGRWMIVDSCRSGKEGCPAALEYLERIGVNIEHDVRLIVATHWHDDHIRGLATLVKRATNAEFICSAALLCEEFLTLVNADKIVKLIGNSSGVSEFAHILDIISKRSKKRYVTGPDHWASEGKRVHNDPDTGVEVWALSPSSQTITDAKAAFASTMPQVGEDIGRFCSQNPNDFSIALMVLAPGINLLLGGDLEKGRDEKRGWQAVLRSTVIPQQASHFYKVAHHGSKGADLDGIWKDLLVEQPYTLIAPYARGGSPLPSNDDIKRIKRHTNHAYCTVWPITKEPKKRDSSVQQTLNEMVITHRELRKEAGHICMRFPFKGSFPQDVSVTLSRDAILLS